MSTVVKENEILTSIPETATARPVASSTAGPSGDTSARPQPVALEVSVTVNGARTVAGSDKREPFSEFTKTVLIFGYGAVVRLSSSVAPGQLLFLTNEKTKKEVVCQVVKSKNYHNVRGYVELEFTEPVAGFWGMRFPTERGTSQSSQPSPIAAAPPPKAPIGGSTIESRPPATNAASRSDAKSTLPSLPRTAAPSQAAPAISAGQPLASSQRSSGSTLEISPSLTRSQASVGSSVSGNDKLSNAREISKTKPATTEPSIPTATTSTASSKSILDSDEVKIPSWLEPLARNAAAASAALPEIVAKEQLKHHEDVLEVQDLAITETGSVPEAANHAVPAPSFGSHLLIDENDSSATETSSSSNKKIWIGAVAAGVLLLVSAGWYMHQPASSGQSIAAGAVKAGADTGNTAQTPSQAQLSTPTQSTPSGTYTAVSAPVPATAGASSGIPATNSPAATNASLNLNKKAPVSDAVSAPAIPQPKKPMLGAVNLSAPIVNRTATGQDHADEVLNLSASSQVGPGEGLASGLSVSNSKQPVAPAAPPPIGGDVKAARLISSVAPTYPAVAKAQRVDGDVKIDAVVDATGHVTSMAIVSGPTLLQQPAMEALRRWKYEPAQLDGKPVPMHLTVTIQFKLQ
jgi:TonB family protein